MRCCSKQPLVAAGSRWRNSGRGSLGSWRGRLAFDGVLWRCRKYWKRLVSGLVSEIGSVMKYQPKKSPLTFR